MCLSDSILLKVSSETTAHKLWNRIGEIYQNKSLINKLFLKRKLYSLKMNDGDLIAKHLNYFNLILIQLQSINVKIEEEDKCILLLCSLPKSWDNLIIAISGSFIDDPKLDAFVATLLSEEMRRNSLEGSKDALHVRGGTKEKGKDKKKGEKDKSKHRSKSKGRSKSPSKSRLRCWNRGKRGYL